MKIAIAYPLGFSNYDKLAATLDRLIRSRAVPLTHVLCTVECPLVAQYARNRGLPYQVFHYHYAYNSYGRPIFNSEHDRDMIKTSDGLVAFHGPRNVDTARIIQHAKARALRVIAQIPIP
jgi:hypothetical protein